MCQCDTSNLDGDFVILPIKLKIAIIWLRLARQSRLFEFRIRSRMGPNDCLWPWRTVSLFPWYFGRPFNRRWSKFVISDDMKSQRKETNYFWSTCTFKMFSFKSHAISRRPLTWLSERVGDRDHHCMLTGPTCIVYTDENEPVSLS